MTSILQHRYSYSNGSAGLRYTQSCSLPPFISRMPSWRLTTYICPKHVPGLGSWRESLKATDNEIQDNELDEAFGLWRSLFPAIICDFSSNLTDIQLRKFNYIVVSCIWNAESIAERTPCTSSECNTECPSSRFAHRSNTILFVLINNWMKNLYILCCPNTHNHSTLQSPGRLATSSTVLRSEPSN